VHKFAPDAFPMNLWYRIMQFKLGGSFNANRVVASGMARTGGSAIVNVAPIDAQMALGRRIEPSEIGETIEFLLSDRASAVTGADLLVDAGWAVANSWHLYGGVPGPVEQEPVAD
jgi:NAD(P)-dependent dehydrogenase (short-subunit alcohol dehydrogenase family)